MGRLSRSWCRAVGHAGTWTEPDARCVRVRACPRCGDVATEHEHTWTSFNCVGDGGCQQQRHCQRCGTTETRVLHSWGPWAYHGPDDFLVKLRQTRACVRCGAEDRAEFERAF